MNRNSDTALHNSDYEIKEQDRFLPIANVGRVMKKALPPHAKLSKESKECIQECVSEFISFITSQASDRGRLEKRKTLNGEDILWSMYILGFENYSETLKIYLAKYRQFEQMEAEKKATKSGRSKASKYEDSFYETGTDETSPSDGKSDYSPDSVNQISEQGENFNFPFEGDSVPPPGQWNPIDNYLDPKYMSNLNARRQSNVRQFNTESEILALEDFVEKME